MKRIIKEGNTTAIVIFIAGFLLFNWPLLSILAERNDFHILLYLLLLWFVVILCLGLYARHEGANQLAKRSQGEKR